MIKEIYQTKFENTIEYDETIKNSLIESIKAKLPDNSEIDGRANDNTLVVTIPSNEASESYVKSVFAPVVNTLFNPSVKAELLFNIFPITQKTYMIKI